MNCTCASIITRHDLLGGDVEIIKYEGISDVDAKKAIKLYPWMEYVYEQAQHTLLLIVPIKSDKYRG